MVSSPRAFLNLILSSLTTISQSAQQTRPRASQKDVRQRRKTNSKDLPANARNILLTLHVLFPHVLLDALDLLDRGCVVQIHVHNEGKEEEKAGEEKGTELLPSSREEQKHHETYYVLSTRSKDRNQQFKTHTTALPREKRKAEDMLEEAEKYQVHVRAWNCSCPAFAFAAHSSTCEVAASEEATGMGGFGGLSLQQRTASEEQWLPPPVCKHLLACLLCDAAPGLFGPFEQVEGAEDEKGAREVSVGTLVAAGLAAGV